MADNDKRMKKENEELRRVLAAAIATIEDFLPYVGHCALQDYGRLNGVLMDSKRLLPSNTGINRSREAASG